MDPGSTVYFDYDNIDYSSKQVQSRIDTNGYTKIIITPDYKKSPNLRLNSSDYFVSAIYLLSRPIHLELKEAVGELIIENTSMLQSDKVFTCFLLVHEKGGVLKGNHPIDTLLPHGSKGGNQSISLNTLIGGGSAVLYNNDSIVLFSRPLLVNTHLGKYEEFLTGDVFIDTQYEFPAFKHDNHLVSFVAGINEKTALIEGLDFSTGGVDNANLDRGFGTFGSTIQNSSNSFNQAGESYVWKADASTAPPTVDPSTYADNSIVDCTPIYTSGADVSTMVVPYGSGATDEVTRMFMTGTFQMFYTTMVGIAIMLFTWLLYPMYFATAMRHGTTENVEYGNKITYSTNMYFLMYAAICIFGVMVDATMYTHSTTEMAFAMMFVVFTAASYMFTLMLRGVGLDPNLYGDLNTKIKYAELFSLYWGFMLEHYDFYYSFVGPIILIGLVVGITILIYQGTNPGKFPFGSMIAIFFLGFLGILSTMGTFMSKSVMLKQSDVVV